MNITHLSQVKNALGIADIDQVEDPNEKRKLDFYDTGCLGFSSDKTNFNIPNDDEIRSQITSSHLFRTTSSELLIYTTGFRKDIINDKFLFIQNLKECLEKCNSVEIIVDEHYNSNVTSVIAELQAKKPESIRLFKAHSNTKEMLSQTLSSIIKYENPPFNVKNPEFHFVIGDKTKYRLEYNGNDKLAKVNYNDPINAQELEKAFQLVKSNSTQFVYHP